ncbi:hypothetical protein [Pseudobacteriovorax antillogorgiicola]|uniref:Uncharacterized protein n=1 Tax=Pseudobacteriovorax antillogorgiicola TaxID=1513793 RepID=A0A1Y6BT49_9BACT|nr:hypothetical protein [Pseudobacteriovorax antillogorgiicola]TCS52999.1 hypothetical protein EDD56_10850 [Pseudobacteriovorax antillogorgiicola]SMF27140.1 hypothetical protein SAMN06296036_108197 [Pseudobacteriovorax antillogorgiicola]
MLSAKILVSIGFLGFAVTGLGNTDVTKAPAKAASKQEKLVKMTFEACCDDKYGDSTACHKAPNVTDKSRKVNGANVKKECYEDYEDDSSFMGE